MFPTTDIPKQYSPNDHIFQMTYPSTHFLPCWQRTWGTATGHEGNGYDIYNFMDRTIGFEFDNSAVPWGCQVQILYPNTHDTLYSNTHDTMAQHPYGTSLTWILNTIYSPFTLASYELCYEIVPENSITYARGISGTLPPPSPPYTHYYLLRSTIIYYAVEQTTTPNYPNNPSSTSFSTHSMIWSLS